LLFLSKRKTFPVKRRKRGPAPAEKGEKILFARKGRARPPEKKITVLEEEELLQAERGRISLQQQQGKNPLRTGVHIGGTSDLISEGTVREKKKVCSLGRGKKTRSPFSKCG